MDLEIIILSEVSQKEKDKYHMISLMYGIIKKVNYIRPLLETTILHKSRVSVTEFYDRL